MNMTFMSSRWARPVTMALSSPMALTVELEKLLENQVEVIARLRTLLMA